VQRSGVRASGKVDSVLMFVNGGHDTLPFNFPQSSTRWYLLLDSADPKRTVQPVEQKSIEVQGHSVMLFGSRVPAMYSNVNGNS
jgi:hypothetical protein